MGHLRIECPHCDRRLTKTFLLSAAGRLHQSLRTKPSGRATIKRPCRYCHKRKWGARDLRYHQPRCPEHPRGIAARTTFHTG